MRFLDDLLARLADQPTEQHSEIIRVALADAQDLDQDGLSELTAAIQARFDSAAGEDGSLDDAGVTLLETLASIADGVGQHMAALAERAQRIADAQARIRSLSPPADSAASELDPSASPAGPEPAEPADAPAPEPTVPGDGDPAAADPALATGSPSSPSARRVPLGLRSTPPPAVETTQGRDTYSLVAAADVSSAGARVFQAGQPLADLREFGMVWQERMRPVIASNTREGRQVSVARLMRQSPPELTVRDAGDHIEGEQVISHATDESRLPGGSLVAAGGWCAPSETLYDLCDIRITDQAMVDLPTVTAQRGGVRYPADFDWGSLWSSVGFHMSEAQSLAGETKRSIEVPCPEDFLECRLDVDGVRIRTPILAERGWPERVAQFTEGVLAVHARRMNGWRIARMEELSIPITAPSPAAPDPSAAIVDPHGPGMVESVLSILELQVEYQRTRERLAPNSTLEMIAPLWLRGVLRSDLRKKLGIDNRWSITNQQLDTYLRNAGVAPQWVYDWQDAWADQDESGFGGTVVPTVWPDEARVLLYPAGTFFALQADVITLDGVYDDDGLRQNMYTSLHTEEGIQVCRRCGHSYVITIPLCPNGLSGGIQTTTCAAPALAA